MKTVSERVGDKVRAQQEMETAEENDAESWEPLRGFRALKAHRLLTYFLPKETISIPRPSYTLYHFAAYQKQYIKVTTRAFLSFLYLNDTSACAELPQSNIFLSSSSTLKLELKQRKRKNLCYSRWIHVLFFLLNISERSDAAILVSISFQWTLNQNLQSKALELMNWCLLLMLPGCLHPHPRWQETSRLSVSC